MASWAYDGRYAREDRLEVWISYVLTQIDVQLVMYPNIEWSHIPHRPKMVAVKSPTNKYPW